MLLDQFKSILIGNFPHIIVIMAQSSGQGGIFNDSQIFIKIKNAAEEAQFENFSDQEAQTFCSCMNVQGEYDNLKELTNNNPYLLFTVARNTIRSNWVEEAKSTLKRMIHRYVTDTFRSLEKINQRDFVDEVCNLTSFFYVARLMVLQCLWNI